MALSRIPSSEEIAAHFARNGIGVRMDQNVPDPVTTHMKTRIQGLEREIFKKRRSAKELQEAMHLLMEKYDFSPAEELVKLAIEMRDEPVNLEIRVGILKELLAYTSPKLKSVEVHGEVEHKHEIIITRWGPDGSIVKETPKLREGGGSASPSEAVDSPLGGIIQEAEVLS